MGWATVTLLRDDAAADLYEVLDSIDGDHETIGATIFDASTGKLAPALEEMLMLPVGDILICDRTWIDPQYRGHDLGLVIKAMTIQVLGRGCAFAVAYPAPFEGELTGAAREHAIERLGAHWSRVGFKHFQDGVWILDLAARTFDDAVGKLREQLRLS